MSVWDELGLASGIEKPRRTRSADKAQTWIKKFSEYLTEQKSLVKTVELKPDQAKKTRGKRSSAHTFWSDEKKVFVFEPRYGTKQVNLQPGRNQITAPTVDEMQARIDKLIQLTKNGDLNAALEEAAKRPAKSKDAPAGDETAATTKAKAKA